MPTETQQTPENDPPLIVMSDLDGTLLDHDTYSFAPALPVITRLRTAGIPLILNTSKTAAELIALRGALNNTDPYVVENGSAIYLPASSFIHTIGSTAQISGIDVHVLGARRTEILSIIQKKRREENFLFTGFSDMEVSEVITYTGLSESEAEQAMTREFSEPLIWQDSAHQLRKFEALIANHGLRLLRGGRFVHVIGACDKGKCLQWFRECFTRSGKTIPQFVALGDSQNDVAMLNAADIAVIVRSSHHEPPDLEKQSSVIITEKAGPQGWAEALTQILDETLT
ncbi:HAD-IIB family hydrolase [Gimesia algae]|uniref:Glucosyl-3-phosphoglycerate/mannosyl-3-phosphoglycerate phosphatase n=1 Tax=Gimesia algae TaxID=2527971 RepID=A0A517VBM5_9PLAN|nr:HAD-IIB family hydrolase [Gimesia algae]QDT90379.1 Glucosyl-3-phosphoglycerate/mannosyl-3-phosphoglycerate phosphatase [Gimesia algae]